MAKPEWGSKRQCRTCGARFYDLNREPIVCPKCEAPVEIAATSARPQPQPAPPPKPAPKKKLDDGPEAEEDLSEDFELEGEDEDEDEDFLEDASELDDDVAKVIEGPPDGGSPD